MADVKVRGYRSGDERALLDLWAAALPYDAIDPPTLRRKVFLDPNVRSDWILLAEDEEGIVGFCIAVARRFPLEKVWLEPHKGWITAMGVRPEHRNRGVASTLLDAALERLRGNECTEVLVSPYTPNYFLPGVDEVRYADGLRFLLNRGFKVVSRPMSMDSNLVALDFTASLAGEAELANQGIQIRPLEPSETIAMMMFLWAHMPGDWIQNARRVLSDIARGLGTFDQFLVAVHDGEILGYCQSEGEHFGPFGVRADRQGHGIGTVLLARALEGMRRRGHHNAWVLWTSDESAERVYARFGFRETRRFAVLRREL
jgi:mycothiol synthase